MESEETHANGRWDGVIPTRRPNIPMRGKQAIVLVRLGTRRLTPRATGATS